MTDATGLLQIVSTGGAIGVLVFVVMALLQGWLVPGYVYRQERQAKIDALNAVLNSTDAQKLLLQTVARRQQDDASART